MIKFGHLSSMWTALTAYHRAEINMTTARQHVGFLPLFFNSLLPSPLHQGEALCSHWQLTAVQGGAHSNETNSFNLFYWSQQQCQLSLNATKGKVLLLTSYYTVYICNLPPCSIAKYPPTKLHLFCNNHIYFPINCLDPPLPLERQKKQGILPATTMCKMEGIRPRGTAKGGELWLGLGLGW